MEKDMVYMNKVSIIMPVYNSEATLKKAIRSVLNQTLDGIELIIINDGSTDNSKEICDYYSKKYQSVKVFQIKNSGAGYARNYGIEQANGEFIAFVDADDWVHPDMYQSLYCKILQYNADIVICGYFREFHKTIRNKSRKVKKRVSCNSVSITTAMDLHVHFNELYYKNYIHVLWNKLYKKAIINKYNIKMNTKMSKGEDLLFNLEYLSKISNIRLCYPAFYHYINRNQSSLSNILDPYDFLINKSLYQSVASFLKQKCHISRNKANADIYLRGCFLIMEKAMLSKNASYFNKIMVEVITDSNTQKAIIESSHKKIEPILYQLVLKSKNKILICLVLKIRIGLKKLIR